MVDVLLVVVEFGDFIVQCDAGVERIGCMERYLHYIGFRSGVEGDYWLFYGRMHLEE